MHQYLTLVTYYLTSRELSNIIHFLLHNIFSHCQLISHLVKYDISHHSVKFNLFYLFTLHSFHFYSTFTFYTHLHSVTYSTTFTLLSHLLQYIFLLFPYTFHFHSLLTHNSILTLSYYFIHFQPTVTLPYSHLHFSIVSHICYDSFSITPPNFTLCSYHFTLISPRQTLFTLLTHFTPYFTILSYSAKLLFQTHYQFGVFIFLFYLFLSGNLCSIFNQTISYLSIRRNQRLICIRFIIPR